MNLHANVTAPQDKERLLLYLQKLTVDHCSRTAVVFVFCVSFFSLPATCIYPTLHVGMYIRSSFTVRTHVSPCPFFFVGKLLVGHRPCVIRCCIW